MRDRGNFIALQQFDKAQQCDEKINGLFSDFESLTRPTAAFITFEEEDIKNLAVNLKTNIKLVGLEMKFRAASEPTDIIWENRIYSAWDYFFRNLIAWFIIALLLACSFAFIFKVARTSSAISREFPKVDCDAIEETYGN